MVEVVRLASDLQNDSIVDGAGIRTVIWMQGCSHNCLGCHNPESHDFNGGFLKNLDDLLDEISELDGQQGITLSGGEPLMQPEAALAIAKYAKYGGLDVWAWSGFVFEQLIEFSKTKPVYLELLKNIDVLVDGKFELENKSLNCKFRGSTNQRILDVAKSLEQNEVVLHEKYN